MKIVNWNFCIWGFAFFVIGLFLGMFIFGMVTHENSHAITCLVFGLRVHSYSLTQVVCEESPNPVVNTYVRLAGGIGQALLSFLFFWYATTLEKRGLTQTLFTRLFGARASLMLAAVFGFELAFLTVAFHGVANGIWEGFFFDSYSQLHDDIALWGIILLFDAIISVYIVQRRYRRLVTRRQEYE